MQRAAEGDVQLLQATANSEQRDIAGDGAAAEAERYFVAFRVFGLHIGRLRRAAIKGGGDVAAAAGENDAGAMIEQGFDIRGIAIGGDEDRHAADHVIDRADIGVGRRVIEHAKDAELFGAAGNTDEGAESVHHAGNLACWARLVALRAPEAALRPAGSRDAGVIVIGWVGWCGKLAADTGAGAIIRDVAKIFIGELGGCMQIIEADLGCGALRVSDPPLAEFQRIG